MYLCGTVNASKHLKWKTKTKSRSTLLCNCLTADFHANHKKFTYEKCIEIINNLHESNNNTNTICCYCYFALYTIETDCRQLVFFWYMHTNPSVDIVRIALIFWFNFFFSKSWVFSAHYIFDITDLCGGWYNDFIRICTYIYCSSFSFPPFPHFFICLCLSPSFRFASYLSLSRSLHPSTIINSTIINYQC